MIIAKNKITQLFFGSFWKRIVLMLTVVLLLLLLLLGCVEEFGINNFKASPTEVELGTYYSLNWSYQDETKLAKQKLVFLKLTFAGIESEEIALERLSRQRAFIFEGPLTILLVATDNNNKEHKASITVRQKQDFHFTVTTTNLTDPRYPYLGGPLTGGGGCSPPTLSSSAKLTFTRFCGFFDADENGLIDDLVQLIPRGSAFRALSTCVAESNDFCKKEGSNYPAKAYKHPELGFANAIIFGGAIITDGEEVCIKEKDKPEYCYRKNVTRYHPVFMAIVLYWAPITNLSNFVDIQLGNLDQGLIVNLFFNEVAHLTGVSESSFDYQNVGSPAGVISGQIKEAKLAWPITFRNGGMADVLVEVKDADFEMPFLPDNQGMLSRFLR